MNTAVDTATQSTWDIDTAHSSVGFTVRHLVISKVHGRFVRWSGSLALDEANPGASRIEARIETASIDTNEAQRDAHLRSADFFDAEQHPEIVFRSTGVTKSGERDYRLSGELTISGVTRPVVLEVESLGTAKDPWGGTRAGFSARTSIDRREFGLTWNQALEAGGVVVGEKIEIAIEVEAVRRAEKSAAAA
jgi:polyisoprenoid-binding protein YceI